MRSLPFAASVLDEPRQRNYAFVRIDFPAPTGTVRMTSYPEGSGFTENIDGLGSAAWSNARPLREGTITLGRDSAVSVTTFFVANLDNYFDDLRILHGSLREVPVEIWRGHFDRDNAASYLGSVRIYKGVIGRVRYGDEAEVSARPPRSSIDGKFPRRRFTTALFPKLPGPDLKISWGTVNVTPPPAPGAPNMSYDTVPWWSIPR